MAGGETDTIHMTDDTRSLAAQVGDFAADASNDLTAFERSKLEDAAHIIARAETEDEE